MAKYGKSASKKERRRKAEERLGARSSAIRRSRSLNEAREKGAKARRRQKIAGDARHGRPPLSAAAGSARAFSIRSAMTLHPRAPEALQGLGVEVGHRPHQLEDLGQRPVDLDVFDRDLVEREQVEAALLAVLRPLAGGLGILEVRRRREPPRRRDHLRRSSEVLGREPGQRSRPGCRARLAAATIEQPRQRVDLEQRRAHALTVDRVEGAERVTGDQQAIGYLDPLVVADPTGGELEVWRSAPAAGGLRVAGGETGSAAHG